MIFRAAGAAFLPERLPKSARNRVLMLPRERAELTSSNFHANPLAGARAVAV